MFLIYRLCHIKMASTFSFTGWIPVCVTMKPIYSILVCFKNYFSILHLSPLDVRFFSTSSNLFEWSYQSLLMIIKRSSMYTLINSILRNISFILSWIMSQEVHTPIGRRLYFYFPHWRIILHTLLASLLRLIW